MVTVLSCQPICQPGAGEERITGDDIAQGRGLRVIRTAVGASDDLVSCGRLTSRVMARAGSGSAGTSYPAGMRRTSPAAQRRTRRSPSQVFVFLRLGYCYLPRSKSFLPRLPHASLLVESRRSQSAARLLGMLLRCPTKADRWREIPRASGSTCSPRPRDEPTLWSQIPLPTGRRSAFATWRAGSGHPSPALVNAWHTSMMSTTPRRPTSPATGR